MLHWNYWTTFFAFLAEDGRGNVSEGLWVVSRGEDRLLCGCWLCLVRTSFSCFCPYWGFLHDQRVQGGKTNDVRRCAHGRQGHRHLSHCNVPDGQLHGCHYSAGHPHRNVQQQHQLLARWNGNADHSAIDKSHFSSILSRFVFNVCLWGKSMTTSICTHMNSVLKEDLIFILAFWHFHTLRRNYKNFGEEVHLFLTLQYPPNLKRKRFAYSKNSSFVGLQNNKIYLSLHFGKVWSTFFSD